MSCKTGVVGYVFFVRWEKPELPDIARILNELTQASRTAGKPVVYVAIMPSESDAPDPVVRKAMMDGMSTVLEHCTTVHMVMEGTGFRAVAHRSALAGILLVGGRRGRVFVHSTIDEALLEAAKQAKIHAAEVLRIARSQGLVQ